MTIKFNDFFGQHEFHAEAISGDEDAAQIATFCYPGAISEAWVPGVAIRVSGITGGSWIGYFLQGKESPNGAELCCAHPDGKHIVVVSRGTPYIVNAADPKDWKEIPIRPVLGYCVAENEGVLILYDYTKVVGLCANGNTWSTLSLSWDGLRSVRAVNGVVEGEGWDASKSAYVPFRIEINTGKSTGGASPQH
jgi:hypothetical protein